jgi:hypothetical protein
MLILRQFHCRLFAAANREANSAETDWNAIGTELLAFLADLIGITDAKKGVVQLVAIREGSSRFRAAQHLAEGRVLAVLRSHLHSTPAGVLAQSAAIAEIRAASGHDLVGIGVGVGMTRARADSDRRPIDRVRTVDGHLEVDSPPGGPTVVTVDLPSHA